jgi:MFS family permease
MRSGSGNSVPQLGTSGAGVAPVSESFWPVSAYGETDGREDSRPWGRRPYPWPAGGLVDRLGTRTPFVVGVVAPAPVAWFMAARIAWGVGSVLVFATAYTIASDVSDGGSRGASMGLVRGGILFGFPAGVVIGGVANSPGR